MTNKILVIIFVLSGSLIFCQNSSNKICEDGKLEKLINSLSKIKMYEFDFKGQGSSEKIKKMTKEDFVKFFLPKTDSLLLAAYSKEIVCCSWTNILKNKIDYEAAKKYDDYPERLLAAQMYKIISVSLVSDESFNKLYDLFYYQDKSMRKVRNALKPCLIERTHKKHLFIIIDMTERGDFKAVSVPLIKLLKKL